MGKGSGGGEGAGLGSGDGGGRGNIVNSILWFLILWFLSLWVAAFCAQFYILLYCLAACIDCLREPCDLLLKGIQWPHTCARNMIEGKPLC